MITPEQIPKEAAEALRESIRRMPITGWAENAAAAMLNAWPGAQTVNRTRWKDGIDIDVPIAIGLALQEVNDQ